MYHINQLILFSNFYLTSFLYWYMMLFIVENNVKCHIEAIPNKLQWPV